MEREIHTTYVLGVQNATCYFIQTIYWLDHSNCVFVFFRTVSLSIFLQVRKKKKKLHTDWCWANWYL